MNKLYTLIFLILTLLLIKKIAPILINILPSKNLSIETPKIITSKYLSTICKKDFMSYCIQTLEHLNYTDVVHIQKPEQYWLIAYKNNIKYLALCLQCDDTENISGLSLKNTDIINLLIGFAYLNNCSSILIISNLSIDKNLLEGILPSNYLVEIIDGTSMFSTLNPYIFQENEAMNI